MQSDSKSRKGSTGRLVSSQHEKRKDPRLENNIPVKICQEDGDIVTETANISRSGVYCRIDRYIEPMSRMQVHLLLPVVKSGKSTSKKITCQGVVVRTEPTDKREVFNIAIFFNNISQRDADTITDYINSFLEKK